MHHYPISRLVALAVTTTLMGCTQPEAKKDEVQWDAISHGGTKRNKPYSQSGFGDCDSKHLIQFTCE